MIKWLIIYALYEKIKRDNGIRGEDVNLHTITQAVKDLNPEQMAGDLYHAFQSIMEEPIVGEFVTAIADFTFRFGQTLFQYFINR